ncbi:uncharacterized protein PODANS_5_5240 [Podospora anserina S mat+]|uniref:Podospora anserina S mat+ genomic DNA chromosome 5, supercontig 5 n=2 Tax=Podospora anserina TaxID=2587412 RepID=B2AMV0_PODAN|nr:uncharacterized protein PODANS_5_5240 [Podospora anserina S mat+]CAD60611.1 unnamed protein product [Podospora anserina]CAP65291.1 unnamed protein product [Podospora anserina S mat+]CDP29502.1 Putative protein of unknown function [Podospora anserina S mat+]
MVIKRKRSDSHLSSFSSALASPPRASSFNFDAISAMDTARRGFFSPRLPTSSHMPGRTRKRFRDNRPPEAIIHQRTLNLLFSAQQQQHTHQQAPSPPQVQVTEPTPTLVPSEVHPDQHQRSLHSFWKLPTRTVASPSSSQASLTSSPSPIAMPNSSTAVVSTTCDDCGVGLLESDACGDQDGIMMDIDGGGEMGENTCGACGKTVCFSCSVSNLGEHRRCLACAGRRDWGAANGSGRTQGVDVY